MNTDASWLKPDEAKTRVLCHQRKLHKWALSDKRRRFCDLWNLVHDPATLQVAWMCVKANKGSRTAGIDGSTRGYVERRYGVERFLTELREELKSRTFQPLPVRQRGISKQGGKIRWLGFPRSRTGWRRWPSR